MRGNHLIKHWSTTQPTVALSSGEAEFKGFVKGATKGLGLQSVRRDLGLEHSVHIYPDSSAAIGMVASKGIGRVRHIQVGELWILDAVKAKLLNAN